MLTLSNPTDFKVCSLLLNSDSSLSIDSKVIYLFFFFFFFFFFVLQLVCYIHFIFVLVLSVSIFFFLMRWNLTKVGSYQNRVSSYLGELLVGILCQTINTNKGPRANSTTHVHKLKNYEITLNTKIHK